MHKNLPPVIEKFPADKQQMLDELLDRNSSGILDSKEKTKLENLVKEAEQLMVENALRLAGHG